MCVLVPASDPHQMIILILSTDHSHDGNITTLNHVQAVHLLVLGQRGRAIHEKEGEGPEWRLGRIVVGMLECDALLPVDRIPIQLIRRQLQAIRDKPLDRVEVRKIKRVALRHRDATAPSVLQSPSFGAGAESRTRNTAISVPFALVPTWYSYTVT